MVAPRRFRNRFSQPQPATIPALKMWLVSNQNGIVRETRYIEKIENLPSYRNHSILGKGDGIRVSTNVDRAPGLFFLANESREQLMKDYETILEYEKTIFIVDPLPK